VTRVQIVQTVRRALAALAVRALWSHVLIVAGLLSFVAFAATFGIRWAFLAAVPCLLLMGVAVDRGQR